MSKITTKLTVAVAAALLASGAAMAQGLTRADVVADLQAARNSGELAAITAEKGTEGLGKAAAAKNVVVKASQPVPVAGVVAPAAAPVAAAQAAAPTGPKTRAEVVAELKLALESGELVNGRINGELGYTPTVRRAVPATMLAGQPKSAQ